jgi:hypothetical protein
MMSSGGRGRGTAAVGAGGRPGAPPRTGGTGGGIDAGVGGAPSTQTGGHGGSNDDEVHRLALCQAICDKLSSGDGGAAGAAGATAPTCGDSPSCATIECAVASLRCTAPFEALFECLIPADASWFSCAVGGGVVFDRASYYLCNAEFYAWLTCED